MGVDRKIETDVILSSVTFLCALTFAYYVELRRRLTKSHLYDVLFSTSHWLGSNVLPLSQHLLISQKLNKNIYYSLIIIIYGYQPFLLSASKPAKSYPFILSALMLCKESPLDVER